MQKSMTSVRQRASTPKDAWHLGSMKHLPSRGIGPYQEIRHGPSRTRQHSMLSVAWKFGCCPRSLGLVFMVGILARGVHAETTFLLFFGVMLDSDRSPSTRKPDFAQHGPSFSSCCDPPVAIGVRLGQPWIRSQSRRSDGPRPCNFPRETLSFMWFRYCAMVNIKNRAGLCHDFRSKIRRHAVKTGKDFSDP